MSKNKKDIKKTKRGFDDSETWDLDCTFSEFMIPRLERYIEITDEIHADKEYQDKVKFFLWALKKRRKKVFGRYKNEEQRLKVQEGLSLFSEILGGLWW